MLQIQEVYMDKVSPRTRRHSKDGEESPKTRLVETIRFETHLVFVIFLINSEHLPEEAIIVAHSDSTEKTWCWCLTLKDFEVVHGISRLVRLTPDKLATAIAICRELRNEDGTFLVDLVVDLLKRFQDLHRQQSLVADANNRDHLDEVIEAIANHNASVDAAPSLDELETLEQNMNVLSENLDAFKEDLSQKKTEELESSAMEILRVSDDLMVFSQIFLDFVHPIWIQIKRSQSVDEEFVEARKRLLEDKLTRNARKLTNEFTSLCNTY